MPPAIRPPTSRSRWRRALSRVCPTARNVLIRRALRALHLGHARRVLVVGAGDDPYRDVFPQAETYVRLDRIRFPEQTDVAADASALPFPDSSFQCALVTEVLEYLPNPIAFASELHRVLAVQGLAVVTVPFVFPEHRDYWRPARRALVDLFRPFASVRICAQGNRLHAMFDLLTTAFTPVPALFPLRVLSNLLFLSPTRFALRDSRSTAPTGFLVVARK
jgi:SAM-dependent methyltransferase